MPNPAGHQPRLPSTAPSLSQTLTQDGDGQSRAGGTFKPRLAPATGVRTARTERSAVNFAEDTKQPQEASKLRLLLILCKVDLPVKGGGAGGKLKLTFISYKTRQVLKA
jgi:hypothetical protein